MENAVAQGQDSRKRIRSKGAAKNGKGNKDKGVGSSDGESEHGMHIWTERERRKKMKNMFNGLHALLPQLPAKADKSTIVDEAIKYISALQQTLQTLEKQRLEKLQRLGLGLGASAIIDHSYTTPSEVIFSSTSQTPQQDQNQPLIENYNNINVIPHDNAFPVPSFPVCFQTWFSPNVVMSMCGEDAQISICSARKPGLLATVLYIMEKHNLDVVSAHVSADQYRCIYLIHAHATGGAASDHLMETLSVEDTFKLAAGEMNLWIASC